MADERFVESLMTALRVKSDSAKPEIEDLIEACVADLRISGVIVREGDPLCKQAIKLYCKANYGYDKDTERFKASYEALKDSMALSGDFSKLEV